jgi:hypothetical protein
VAAAGPRPRLRRAPSRPLVHCLEILLRLLAVSPGAAPSGAADLGLFRHAPTIS